MTEPQIIKTSIKPILLIGSIAYGFLSLNPVETVWSGFVLWLTLHLFWWQRTPGILLFVFLIQFIESHGVIIEANNYAENLNAMYPDTGKRTFWLSSFGYVAVIVGFHMGGARHFKYLPKGEEIVQAAGQLSFYGIFLAVLASQFFVSTVQFLIPFSSSLRQIEIYVSGISVALIFVLACHHFIRREKPWLFYGFFLYYFISSFYSYFSNWKTPLIILLLASMATIQRINFRNIAKMSPLIVAGALLIFVWQSIKGEYREFLSQGQRTQGVYVSQTDALLKFSELTTDVLYQDTVVQDEVVRSTMRRVGYTEYFAAAIQKVPDEIPFEKGTLLKESAEFALVPRILNPNKGIKDDKLKVERYTDFYFGANSFASFSLGHYCEAYIDWGPIWMHLQLILYGLYGALIMRWTLSQTNEMNPLLRWGILFVLLSSWGTFQQDMVTVLGTTVWGTTCHLLLFLPLYKKVNQFYSK